MPAPDSPVISIFAISSCAALSFSCICCAWRIRLPSAPFMFGFMVDSLAQRLDRAGTHGCAEALLEQLDHRIAVDRRLRVGRARGSFLQVTLRRRVVERLRRGLDDEAQRMAGLARQRLLDRA